MIILLTSENMASRELKLYSACKCVSKFSFMSGLSMSSKLKMKTCNKHCNKQKNIRICTEYGDVLRNMFVPVLYVSAGWEDF